MSRLTKQKNTAQAELEVKELEALGYRIVKYKPWHWRVFKTDYPDNAVDIWPSVKKNNVS